MGNYKNKMMIGLLMVVFAVVVMPHIGGELMVVNAEDIALTAGETYSLSCTATTPPHHTYVMPEKGYFYCTVTPTNITVDGVEPKEVLALRLDVIMSVNGEIIDHESYVEGGKTYISGKYTFEKGTVIDIAFANIEGFIMSGEKGDTLVNYNISITNVTPSNFETEVNDTKKKANSVKKGKTYKGLIMSPKDDDWYVFKAPKKGKYQISLSVTSSDTDVDDLRAEAWKGTKCLSTKWMRYGGGYDTVFSGTLKKGQKIYIKCYNHDSITFGGNLLYNLKVKKK